MLIAFGGVHRPAVNSAHVFEAEKELFGVDLDEFHFMQQKKTVPVKLSHYTTCQNATIATI